jgi:hypothetical protein
VRGDGEGVGSRLVGLHLMRAHENPLSLGLRLRPSRISRLQDVKASTGRK